MGGGILFVGHSPTFAALILGRIVQPATSTLLLVLFSAAVLALLLTDAARRLALRLQWLDQPGVGRVHKKPVPRIGGLAIFAAFAGILFAAIWLRDDLEFDTKILGLLLGAGLITLVMFIDDVRGLPPLPKFLAQIAAAGVAIQFDIVIKFVRDPFGGGVSFPEWLALPLDNHIFFAGWLSILITLFWIVGMMNAINFVDGYDGLAGGLSFIGAGVLFFLSLSLQQFSIAFLPLILAGAILGFLPLNVYRARIIMGDSGAHFLGFALGTIAIIGGAKLATTLLIFGVPAIDVAWSIIRRTLQGGRFYQRDTGHLHHRLSELGLPPLAIAVVYWSFSALFGAIALLLPTPLQKIYALGILGIIVAALLVVLARSGKGRLPPELR
ncbi:MAG: MraY family glycosyltransferase [Chloroflexota bacterium]|nr:MraY family glycosyltransferase [Chloroflexota bacterium]MDE2839065.1 MraY family glycosyltransferase [Chloroflexota bacterium]MDE2931211.1 MraY family glycosyltransferase [Chloroflexota bacterium]